MDRRRDTVRSVEMLRQINAPIVGTVLNRATVADSYAYYNYGYGEKSSDKVEVKTGGKMRGTPITATMNGNGDMGGNTNPVKVLPGEVGDADWPSMGRHAKLGQSTAPGTPTLFPPQTGDGPGE
jgi:Mrp family chromosome partitioning ATPase